MQIYKELRMSTQIGHKQVKIFWKFIGMCSTSHNSVSPGITNWVQAVHWEAKVYFKNNETGHNGF